MKKISLNIFDKNGKAFCKDESKREDLSFLTRHHNYELGDYFQIQIDSAPRYIWVQLDESLKPALIYMKKKTWRYTIPFPLERESPYPENSFMRRNGYSWARLATEDEINTEFNLSQNPYDQHSNSDAFPHASANAETQGKSVFLAKNAIDGVLANESHGNYPFQSWGIDNRKDAKLKLDFGRKILIKKVGLVLRADYPHDSYWKSAVLKFDNNQTLNIELERTRKEQFFKINDINSSYVELSNLVQDCKVPGYVALTQIEIFGHNIL